MSLPTAIDAMMQRAPKKFGSVDLIANDAGIEHVTPVDKFSVGKGKAILSTNPTGAIHTVRLALLAARARVFGWVDVSTRLGLAGFRPSAWRKLTADWERPDDPADVWTSALWTFAAAVIALGGYFAHTAWQRQIGEAALKATALEFLPLEQALARAKTQGQPVLVDFSAIGFPTCQVLHAASLRG